MICLERIPIFRRCEGYYLRWYYNGWHYWYFYQGKIGYITEGEKYRTLGTQTLTIGTGQITEAQANAIRTIMNTREIYIYTDAGWGAVRAVHSPLTVYDHVTHGYEMEFTIVIGSRAISISGFSPVSALPSREPDPQCEVDIAVAVQIWMCKNWDAAYPGSRVYNDDESNRVLFGGLYTHDQVMTPGFCPAGWHVPTMAEWNILITACGGLAAAGGVLKEVGITRWNAPNTGAVDTHGFTMPSTGFYRPIINYQNLYEQAFLWATDGVVRFDYDSAAITLSSLIPTNIYMCLRLIKNYYCPACVALAATNIGNSSFTANWTAVAGATGYYLDVSTSPTFASFVPGYHDLMVGNVTTYNITGLTPGVMYYYRMRAQTIFCTSIYSNSVPQVVYGSRYGALYNWFAATDARNICAAGWHIPVMADFATLMRFLDPAGTSGANTAGGQMKETGTTYWNAPNTGASNSAFFNARGTGERSSVNGSFGNFNIIMYLWNAEQVDAANGRVSYLSNSNGTFYTYYFGGYFSDKKSGHSIRPIKDSTILSDGEEGTYTGNNGRIYRTICIGTQEYLADNLAETLYRDGSAIPEVTDAATWAALATGARCCFNNDCSNM